MPPPPASIQYNVPSQKIARDIGGNVDDNTCKFLSYECGEANLDIQYIMGIGQDIPTTFWSTDDDSTFANWISQVAAAKDIPWVHSVSYGQVRRVCYGYTGRIKDAYGSYTWRLINTL